jgi:uncharacterized protein (UPF0335 family)
MGKIKAIIWLVAAAAAFLYGGYQIIKFVTGASAEEKAAKVKKLELLIKEGKTVTAVYDSVYSEVKIKGVKVKSIKYFYAVDGKNYEGKHYFKEEPTESVVAVKYLPSEPSFNEIDPEAELKEAKEDQDSKADLYVGLVLIVVGAGGALYNLKKVTSA